MDVYDNDDFDVCTPQQGRNFDYSYDPDGDNIEYNKMNYKYTT